MTIQLTNQQYINLETFRKSGSGVKTPVWFVQDGVMVYVRTIDNSAKVKRIRNNGQVNIAVCKADGALLGDWVSASARELAGADVNQKVDHMLDKKYGLMKKMFALVSALQGRKYTVLEIKINE
ncbi:MAG: PPOX class F420-dependent oxidoreductase [Chloroflexota bacterium]